MSFIPVVHNDDHHQHSSANSSSTDPNIHEDGGIFIMIIYLFTIPISFLIFHYFVESIRNCYFPVDRRRRGGGRRDDEEGDNNEENDGQKYTAEERLEIRLEEIKSGIIVLVSSKH